ncbi:helix-turn-helix domain-containing protein [Evansella tamaricis]|uniref:Helix-turn-helix domain-containing protein n=1 Tax=Evansella tamaricis TaxID=2069301 RepID=A0ABS6JF70_9BACI|nr:helix-turn-helix transcriptional regulator [Evansella tamaricis]MBU9711110.1 helix-turn-helix domain-containing protein [Evansella tamaricis]
MDITPALKKARIREGISQEELAFRMNRSRSSVTKMELGKQKIHFSDAVEWFKHTNAQDILIATLVSFDPTIVAEAMRVMSQLVGGMVIWMI